MGDFSRLADELLEFWEELDYEEQLTICNEFRLRFRGDYSRRNFLDFLSRRLAEMYEEARCLS